MLFKAPVQASSVHTFCSGGNQLYRLLRRSRPGWTRCCGMICARGAGVKQDICKPSKQQRALLGVAHKLGTDRAPVSTLSIT